ncbi:UDP-glucosyltransferase 2-like [Schistocerca americana]|uniref:UDP-glucosyltransferase 2-like n=1 Tax=Schistocerca americana TaxID=7009 RepID=UPI001F4FD327|nr:UDP-glucosyltransferase 2-like [Schistocerca americana]
MKSIFVLLAVVMAAGQGDGARILGLFDFPGKSHFMMFEEVLKALAARGHEVIVYSHNPQEKPIPNYKDVSLVGSLKGPPGGVTSKDKELGINNPYGTLKLLEVITVRSCEKVLQHPAMQALMKSNEKFDLIFTETFTTDCMLPFVHKFQAPNIAISSTPLMPWTADRFGIPDNPSYIPVQSVSARDHMGFLERLSNTWYLKYSKWFFKTYIDTPTNQAVKKFFGDSLPPLSEIAKNTSMLFVNTNPALNPPRPLVPAVVEIGGIHLKPKQKLPEDIQKFMDEAEHGVIFFTFGSVLQARDLSDEKRSAILEAFAELPQRVIWKWEAENLPGQPPNLLVRKWLPQYEILSHPKMRVFITHGGLMGTTEAVYNGVPLLGIPLFGDQFHNIKMAVRRGVAILLPFPEMTKNTLLESLRTLLNDSGYRKRATMLSEAYKDRPMSPREAAVYWSEYVIRHKGARHLRSAAVDLEWYQLLLLDVIAFIVLGCIVVAGIGLLLLIAFLRCIGVIKGSAKAKEVQAKSKKSKQQ